jgi:hypothetical protein
VETTPPSPAKTLHDNYNTKNKKKGRPSFYLPLI